MTGSSSGVVTVTNPFVGPRFIETGQKIFGRDREIEQLYYLLSAERVVLLHSPSGAGKSSLVRAGLIPRLKERFDVWGPTRVSVKPPEGCPIAANRFVQNVNFGFEAGLPEERQRPAKISAMGLSEYVAGRPRRRSASPNIVLIFDQFEEILTIDPLDLKAKHEFFAQVGKLLQDPRVWALFALREDYLAPLDPYAEQVPTHLKNRFRLDLLGREAARDVIARSVEEGGRTFAPEAVGKLVNDLATMQVQRPDGTFDSQTGPYVEPLHLQVACRELWNRLPEDRRTIDVDDIQLFGDVTKALADYYEREVAKIAGGDARVERALREWVGGKLITADGIRGQVLKGAGESEGLDNKLIGRLEDTYLVRGEQRAGATWYELSHDRLIEPVRTNNKEWFEAHLSKVQKVASVWETQGRPEGLLLLREDLVEARQWAQLNVSSLTGIERRFLEASEAKQEAIRREQRQARRLRLALAVMAVLAVAATIAAGWAYFEKNEAQKQRGKAEKSEDKAEKSEEKAKESEHDAVVQKNEAQKQRDNATKQEAIAEHQTVIAKYETAEAQKEAAMARARQLAATAIVSQSADPELSVLFAANAVGATWPWGHTVLPEAVDELHRAIMASHVTLTLSGHGNDVTSVAWSPDGKRLATASKDSTAKVWDADTGRELLTLRGHGAAVSSVAWSPDGKRLATASKDSTAKVWDADTGKELLTLRGHSDRVNSAAWSPDGKRVATGSGDAIGGKDNTARVWDTETGKELLTLRGHSALVWSVAWSPDGKHLATGSLDNTAKVWDVETGKELLTLSGNGWPLLVVAWSPDGKRLATGSVDYTAKLWDAETGKELLTLSGHSESVDSVAWSPDGKRLATGSLDHTAKLWDTETGKELLTLRGHSDLVWSVAWSPDGKRLATGSGDKTAKVWDAESSKELLTLKGHRNGVLSVAWSPDGERLATGSWDGTAKVWNAESSKELFTLKGHRNGVLSVAWSPDGGRLATGSYDLTAKVWDAKTGKELMTLSGHRKAVDSVAWSPDGKRLATASGETTSPLSPRAVGDVDTATVWDAESSKELLTLRGHAHDVASVAWSPDGKRLATGSYDNTAKVWDAETGKELLTLSGHSNMVYGVAWSPDGKRLATVSSDHTVRVWNTETGKELLTLSGHGNAIHSVAWSPDGKLLATGGADKTAKVWDAATGEELRTLSGHSDSVDSVAWSPNGKRLATAGADGLVQIYTMDIHELMALARQRVTAHPSDAGCKKYMQVEKCPPFPTLSRW